MTAPYKIYAPETRRQLSQMDLLASPSRTGGHAADEDALLSYAVQEQFREHIEVKLDSQRSRFGAVLDDSWGKLLTIDDERDAYYAAVDMLLLLRKLREGIVASKRRDAFAVEVYETAARLALKTASLPHLISSLSGLVRDLYPVVPRPGLADDALAITLSKLSVDDQPQAQAAYVPPHVRRGAAARPVPPAVRVPTRQPPSADERDLFCSIFLILQISHHQSPAAFVEVLTEMTGSPSALYASAPADLRRQATPRKGKEVAQPFLSTHSSTLALPRRIYRAHITSNHVALNHLLAPNPPVPVHPLERLALLYGLPKQREAAWRVARAAYRDVGPADLAWMEQDVLGFQGAPNRGKGERWLEGEKGCTKGSNGRWLLKTGRE